MFIVTTALLLNRFSEDGANIYIIILTNLIMIKFFSSVISVTDFVNLNNIVIDQRYYDFSGYFMLLKVLEKVCCFFDFLSLFSKSYTTSMILFIFFASVMIWVCQVLIVHHFAKQYLTLCTFFVSFFTFLVIIKYKNMLISQRIQIEIPEINDESNFIINIDDYIVNIQPEVVDTTQICTICLDDFQVKNICRLKNCEHEFHIDCIKKWLQIKLKCPLCLKI